jgi:hypothetical protein
VRSAFLTLALIAPLASLAPAQRPERPGVATGEWTAPTPEQDGLMQGLLRRADGTILYGISAKVTVLRDGHVGGFFGHLQAVDDGPPIGPLISVAGTWKDNGHGLGVFEGDFYIEGIVPMMPVIVVGGILGEFGHELGTAGPESATSYARAVDAAVGNPRSGAILCPAGRGDAAKASDAVAKAPADLARRAGGQPEKAAAMPPKTSQFFASWNL